jgi:Holliday junction DNA helicase RuvA
MIAKLKGIVDQVGDDWAVIDVGGVGYLVYCASRTLARLQVGAAAQVHVETWVREDAILLYGFYDLAERDWFRLLTTVQGVGAKVGLALLSAAPPDQLVRAIAAGDKTVLTQASGVGPKLAVRILSELKDKVGGLMLGHGAREATPVSSAVAASGGALEDAVSALVNLGYRRIEAFEAAGAALAELGEGTPETALIRAALKRLAKDLTR